jgi:hypothetical protein
VYSFLVLSLPTPFFSSFFFFYLLCLVTPLLFFFAFFFYCIWAACPLSFSCCEIATAAVVGTTASSSCYTYCSVRGIYGEKTSLHPLKNNNNLSKVFFLSSCFLFSFFKIFLSLYAGLFVCGCRVFLLYIYFLYFCGVADVKTLGKRCRPAPAGAPLLFQPTLHPSQKSAPFPPARPAHPQARARKFVHIPLLSVYISDDTIRSQYHTVYLRSLPIQKT